MAAKPLRTIKWILSVCLAAALVFALFPMPAQSADALSTWRYSIDRSAGVLYGIKSGTSADYLKEGMDNSADSIAVLMPGGSELASGQVTTGMSVALRDGTDSLTLVVCGDPSADGTIDITDYTLTRFNILGLQTLTGAAFAAADVNGDGQVDITDYTMMRFNILGLKTIIPPGSLLPLSGVTIGLDPGHQRYANYEQELISPYGTATKAKVSTGTSGRFTYVPERDVNLAVGLILRDKLEALGATVIMTRTTHDVDISNAERAVMMNNVPVDCWLRIHADGSLDPSLHGIHILIPTPGTMYTSDPAVAANSAALAQALLTRTIAQTGATNLGLNERSDQTGFCWSKVPVCNIEMGYMTNETEDRLLVTTAYQTRIAEGLAQGFLDYFED